MGAGSGPQSLPTIKTLHSSAQPEWGVQDEAGGGSQAGAIERGCSSSGGGGGGRSSSGHDSDDDKHRRRRRFRLGARADAHLRALALLRARLRPRDYLLLALGALVALTVLSRAVRGVARLARRRGHGGGGGLLGGLGGVGAGAFGGGGSEYARVYALPYPPHMYAVAHTVHVLVPAYNAEGYVVEGVESVLRQSHARVRVWAYNDGSTDNTGALLNIKFKADPRVVLLSNKVNLGPAQTKWLGFRAIYKEALPNDIVVVLDGDDHLLSDDALAVVHGEYLAKKCWFTYGSYVGAFSREVRALDADTHLDFRAAAWRYGHPRSFKAFLIGHLTEADFKHADGTWLTKGTDRGFILRFLELSGPARISFIRVPIYFYRKHASNTYSLISKESKMAQLEHVNSLPRSSEIEEDIHVFLVTWGRVHLLHETIQSLVQLQTVAHRVKLHIWNNNPLIREQVDAIVTLFPSITLDVIHSKINLFSYARFLHIKKVMAQEQLDYVVIVDDDQQFPPDYLEQLWNDRRPRTYTSWWGRKFKGQSYFKGVPDYKELANGARPDIKDFDYAGPGGCIIDANAFAMAATLAIPQRYATLDDLWLSYVMHMAHWSVRRTLVRPRTITDDRTTSVALWSRLKDHKDEFLTYLRDGGWNV